MNNPDDWCRFEDDLPRKRPEPMRPDPSANKPMDLTGALAESPAAAANWNRPTGFAAFPTGCHLAIISRSEWRQGNAGREYLFIVWSEANRRRGFSLVDPVFLKATTQQGRQFALRKLSLIAAASGIELPASGFQPSMLLGACANIQVGAKPHWSDPQKTVQAIAKYLPPPPAEDSA